MADDVPDVARDLYQLPPAEFVAARDALAKHLRVDGDRETATAVKALRRPSVAAGFLNALAHDHPDELAALIDLGDDLGRAQESRVRGEDADISGLAKARREAIGELTALSGAADGPHGATVASTLEAASADPGLAAQVRSGTLVDVPSPGGDFGFGFGFALSDDEADDEPAPRRPVKKTKGAKGAAKKSAGTKAAKPGKADADDEQAKADEVAARRRAKALAAADAAESEADSLLATADEADAEVERLRAELSVAESRATEASKAARQAATAARAARKKADRLSSP